MMKGDCYGMMLSSHERKEEREARKQRPIEEERRERVRKETRPPRQENMTSKRGQLHSGRNNRE